MFRFIMIRAYHSNGRKIMRTVSGIPSKPKRQKPKRQKPKRHKYQEPIEPQNKKKNK